LVGVREATPEDTEAIVSVTAEGWRTGYREIVPRERLAELPIDRWRHEVGVGLRRPVDDAFTYIAEIDGDFVGYCYVAAPSREPDVGPETAELVAIYVDPGHWRRGAGEALMKAALERLSRLPYAEVVLWTFKENERAIAFYEKHGWSPDGAEKSHARTAMPAVRYRRPAE
jgi:ribosomal protein S18 acetylase RimI-like enzyme